jgi:hypothetical protein
MKKLIILLIAVTFTFVGVNNTIAAPNCTALAQLARTFTDLCDSLQACVDHTCDLADYYWNEYSSECPGGGGDIADTTLRNDIEDESSEMENTIDCLQNNPPQTTGCDNVTNAQWLTMMAEIADKMLDVLNCNANPYCTQATLQKRILALWNYVNWVTTIQCN